MGPLFFVGRAIPGSEEICGERQWLIYLVSNRHVVFEGGATVGLFNRRDGGEPDTIDIDQNDWVAHPTSDLAACSMHKAEAFQSVIHRHTFVREETFITREMLQKHDIGVGDEVVMVGRFVNLQHTPAVRFGSISAPLTPIRFGKPWPHTEECFAAEMRSRTGFSGSAVWAYRLPTAILSALPEGADRELIGLLGVNCGYIMDRSDDGEEENTWLNAVIPAWKIMELLDTPALKATIIGAEEEMRRLGR